MAAFSLLTHLKNTPSFFHMAWRIQDAVTHGEIDNTVPGITRGVIYLLGSDTPVTLDLSGDCWRDIAGCILYFKNPKAHITHEASSSIRTTQRGSVGDMTASKKCKIIEDFSKIENAVWKNIVYLEWFDEFNGRVLIEGVDYETTISEPKWKQDTEQEAAQKMSNQLEMRNFIDQILQRRAASKSAAWDKEQADEFEWEERLKESDRLTDAFQEVLEKYIDEPDSMTKQAYAMGWDGMLGALAGEESQNKISNEELDAFIQDELEWEGLENEFDDFGEAADEEHLHPLLKEAQCTAGMAFELAPIIEDIDEATVTRLDSLLFQVAAKLGGILLDQEEVHEEPGLALAVLKRCLNWQNEALNVCQELLTLAKTSEHKKTLKDIRAAIFSVRDGIVALRREIKQN